MSTQTSRLVIPTNAAFPISYNWYGSDGSLDDTVDAVDIQISDAMGVEVLATTAMTDGTDGTYTITLAAQTAPKVLYATLSDNVTGLEIKRLVIEVVGNLLFEEFDARGRAIKGVNPLADATNYPDDLIRAGRSQVTDQFELRTGRSFIRRYARAEFIGQGAGSLVVNDGIRRASTGEPVAGAGAVRDIIKVTSCTVGSTAVAASAIKFGRGMFYNTVGSFARGLTSSPFNVVIEYEYGMDPVPFEAQEEGLKMLFGNLVPSDVAGRATSFSNEDGTFRLTTWPRTVEDFIMRNDYRLPF